MYLEMYDKWGELGLAQRPVCVTRSAAITGCEQHG
uniref:Uncharacterized protein n=1 Tax=Anguilla anguilla TaxID=7936 RepID=A0A0E9WN45_ANGAN